MSFFFRDRERETGITAQGEEQDTKVMLDWPYQWDVGSGIRNGTGNVYGNSWIRNMAGGEREKCFLSYLPLRRANPFFIIFVHPGMRRDARELGPGVRVCERGEWNPRDVVKDFLVAVLARADLTLTLRC